MIAPPLNDQACLGPTTDVLVAEIAAGNPVLVDLAERFDNTDDLAAWIRTLPQRDDNGDPNDGPKVDACRPPQRLDLANPSPNCFERSCLLAGAGELIEPHRVWRLATVSTPNGLHTYPTRDGLPVILDPHNARNATPRPTMEEIATRRLRIQRLIGLDDRKGLRFDLANARRSKERGSQTWVDGKPIDEAIATYEKAMARYLAILAELDAHEDALFDEADRGERNSAALVPADAPLTLTPAQAIDHCAELAMPLAVHFAGGMRRVENGQRVMHGVLAGTPIAVADARDVAFVLALAERAARTCGLADLKIVHSTARAVDALDQIAGQRATAPRNNPWALFALNAIVNNKDVQRLLGSLTKVGGRIAADAGVEAAKLKLHSAGVSQPMIAAFERELNREGLTLGALAKPAPMAGSLDAMTPQALAGRWLAQKL
ncbi:MAG: hypothetical protein SFX73_17780 [Kofleriaceae bacterium]|nr:hypothetical protein [Kofleriaceae bacterium]